MTTVAKGRCTSAPPEVEIAIGIKPIIVVIAVNKMGRKRSCVASYIRFFKSVIPLSFNSLNLFMSMSPFNTATPKSTINPTPAEILKGIPRINKTKTPPMVAKGTAI